MTIENYFGEYQCVFVCDPAFNSPYAIFATKEHAKTFKKSVESTYPIMQFKKWLVITDER